MKDAQENSLQAQQEYFTEYIQRHPGWVFAGMYSDDGISGLSIRERDGFNSMVTDALDGKIDLILTKSLSRFARNTVDALTTIRSLKAAGVAVYFQKENINTMDSTGEFLITLMSSFAEEESRSISENVTWAVRHRYAQGIYHLPGLLLGYQRSPVARSKSMKPEPESCGSSTYLPWLGKAAQISAAFLWTMEFPPRGRGIDGNRTLYVAF